MFVEVSSQEDNIVIGVSMHIGKSYCFLLCSITMLVKISSFRSLRIARNLRTVAYVTDKSSAIPADPINFTTKFCLPKHVGKMILESKNAHPLDSKIVFDAENHKYYFDGIEIERSVTEVIGNYFEVFDADFIARRMISGSNWPRPEYTQKSGEPYTVSPLVQHDPKCDRRLLANFFGLCIVQEEEIKKKWAGIGEYAKNAGTWMHFNIERYLNNLVRTACNRL